MKFKAQQHVDDPRTIDLQFVYTQFKELGFEDALDLLCLFSEVNGGYLKDADAYFGCWDDCSINLFYPIQEQDDLSLFQVNTAFRDHADSTKDILVFATYDSFDEVFVTKKGEVRRAYREDLWGGDWESTLVAPNVPAFFKGLKI